MPLARPANLNDKLYDFVPGATFKINTFNLREKGYTGFFYVTEITAGVVGTATFLTPVSIISAVGHPVYPTAVAGDLIYLFQRDAPAAGFYQDTYYWTYATPAPPPSLSNPYPLPGTGFKGTKKAQFYVLQKAVAIVNNSTSTPIPNNDVLAINININFEINLRSRGVITESWTVEYKNTSSVWVPAVDGVDYQTVSYLSLVRKLTLKFLKPYEFRIINKVVGETSTSNLYAPIDFSLNPRTLVTYNEDFHTFYMKVTDPSVIPDPDPDPVLEETILFPKIRAKVDGYFEIVDEPLKTYSGIGLKVTSEVLFATGIWKIGGVDQPKTNGEWLDAMNINCNIKLNVTRADGSLIFTPMDGLGMKEFTIKEVGEIFFNYTTTLK